MSASTNFSIKQRLVIEFLTQNIATGDEPWVHRYDPENNRQSMEYRHPGSPIVKKFKTFPSAKKNHAHHLLGCKGVLYTEFLTEGSTVNSDRYCATLWNTQAMHPQNQAGKKHVSFASRQRKATLRCTNSGRHGMPEIYSGSTPSLQPRFGTIRLLVVPRIQGDVKMSTFFIGCRS